MSPHLEIQLIAIIVAVACSIPGVFLVLRKMAMMTDAITHTILLGIVVAFFLVKDFNSPLLIIGATCVGLITVYLVETLTKTRLVSEDSAIGIVFPLLFSIAIILISRYAGNAHIDTDSVLLGELAFAPFNRMIVFGVDIGPKALYTMSSILLVNLVLVILFFKELKLSIFDPELGAVLGFSPTLLLYGLMTSVSVTTVGAFEAVGSILVIAFMVGPPISAYLITDDLKQMVYLSAFIGGLNAVLGFRIAVVLDVSIAGAIAMMIGITFLLIFCFAPKRGLLSIVKRRKSQKIDYAKKSMMFHILQHENEMNAAFENGVTTIYQHLNWDEKFAQPIVEQMLLKEYLVIVNGVYNLTELGRKYAADSYEEICDGQC